MQRNRHIHSTVICLSAALTLGAMGVTGVTQAETTAVVAASDAHPPMSQDGGMGPGSPPRNNAWEHPMRGHGHTGRWHKHHAWLKLLGLTPDQVNKIKELRASTEPARQQWREQMRANRLSLRTTAPTDPSYAGLVSRTKELMAAKIQAQAEFKARVYKEVLTDEQRSFALALMKHQKVVAASRPMNAPAAMHSRPMPGMTGPHAE